MPKRTDIKRVLVIGSGPIVIGQACEFDYSGTQAIKALRSEGLEVILVNSNPATIMTDPELSDRTYVEPHWDKARGEVARMQVIIDEQNGSFKLAAWDWQFYAEQVRKAEYDLNESEVKPYFELDRVLRDGVFFAAGQLYGLTFKQRTDIPVYHPDVKVYEVFEANGASLGLFYADWLNFVGTSRARSKIKHLIHAEEKARAVELGRKLFDKESRRYDLNPKTLIEGEPFARALTDFAVGKAEADAITKALWDVKVKGVNGDIAFIKQGPAGKESAQNVPSVYLVKIEGGKVVSPKF